MDFYPAFEIHPSLTIVGMATATVAIIGLGPLGLVTLKNLLEKCFKATEFDKADVVGGLWNYRDDCQTTVLENTPEARHIQRYLYDYASNFSLQSHIRLQTEIVHVDFDKKSEQWTVRMLKDGATTSRVFDKIVLAAGINKLPLMPKIDGLDVFEGEVIHSAGYKRSDIPAATA
ncbi:hypothetical protein J3459_008175 [Metarhizium acridum]|uniref:uncharacterized protein n=1 Tax=Metarhizium acridum TaxID=92637 RepID=UPI001C6AB974|nr:hypothetical protein J3458_018731 [Metarhizium acridum]KAG8426403.1 hypothetical protein J3459_008175 [Metarhizium acridum]